MSATLGHMVGAPASSRWKFIIAPRWVAWHFFVVASVVGMLWLGDWQLRRAEGGNGLSWAYTFEWPIFAVFAIVFWIKTIRDEVHPPDAAGEGAAEVPLPTGLRAPAGAGAGRAAASAEEDDPELAAYNAYLARLTKEVKGHGKWHGLR